MLLLVTLVVPPALTLSSLDADWKVKRGFSWDVLTIETETELALPVKFPKRLEPFARVVVSCVERFERVEERLSLHCNL